MDWWEPGYGGHRDWCIRRLSKEYERKVQTSETLIEVAMIRLPLARLGRSA
jgi:hypothetical protein